MKLLMKWIACPGTRWISKCANKFWEVYTWTKSYYYEFPSTLHPKPATVAWRNGNTGTLCFLGSLNHPIFFHEISALFISLSFRHWRFFILNLGPSWNLWLLWNVCFKQPGFFSLLGPRLPKRPGKVSSPRSKASGYWDGGEKKSVGSTKQRFFRWSTMDVSLNGEFYPASSIFLGFFPLYTIYFGVFPVPLYIYIYLETSTWLKYFAPWR